MVVKRLENGFHLLQSSDAILELAAKFLLCDSLSCHLTTHTNL